MPNAAVMGDKMKHDSPHCHAPIHPAAPVPTPVAHPSMMPAIVSLCAPTVMIGGKQAAVVGAMSAPCSLASCVPAGPGMVVKGSMTVMFCVLPAARVDDICAFLSCVAPIPGPTGKIMSPGVTDVKIGG
jgi:uncharacterized Zn-binding protein involved in type VI secretion